MATYRPNVAAILRIPKSGKILICQRKDHSRCWQFPQGGVDKGEDLIAALYREVEEEVGISSAQYSIHSCRTGYRYQFPDGKLKKGRYLGQEQSYFLCDFTGKKKAVKIDGQEFIDAKWILPEEFNLKWVPPFKQHVFKLVFRDFFSVKFK